MATKITNSNHGDSLQGSPEKRLDVSPDGTLWALIVTSAPGQAKFFRSRDGGSTWTYASGSDLSLRQTTGVPSLFIDADGYAHVSWVTWNNDPQLVMYARGTPSGGGGWSWQTRSISPAQGRLGVDTDIVAFRSGSGWTVWICWNTGSGGRTSRLRVSSSGSITVEATATAPSGTTGYQPGALEFVHTGDGRTPSAAPSLLYTQAKQGSTAALSLNRCVYSGGSWTWDAPVAAVPSVNIQYTTLTQAFDGERLIVAYATAGSNTVNVFEWTPGQSTITNRNPPSAPSGIGQILAISISIDPETDDVYLVWYDRTDGDIQWSKLTRATNTWSPWAVAISRSQTDFSDGKVQLVRHPPRDSIDMIYGIGSGASWQIYSQQLTSLVRAPSAPTLLYPETGTMHDLAAGFTFRWRYNPVSPGDKQQGWYFRRKATGLPAEYWNASTKEWSTSNVALNIGGEQEASFGEGKWASNTSYMWTVRTRSSTGQFSAWAQERSVTATSAPVAIITAPVGIVYGDLMSLIEWAYTGADVQRSYEIAVFTNAQAAASGFDPATSPATWRSGTVSSAIARSARVEVPLEGGVGYRAYLRATSSIGVSSAWDDETFVISVSPPLGPIVELREQIRWETLCPRVRLDISAQSNFMSKDQALGQGTLSWEPISNVSALEAQADDSANQLIQSLKLTAAGPGLIRAQTAPGSPPEAPFGQPQPLGPLDWPVTPGAPYTALAAFKSAGAARAGRVVIRWYDADDGTGSLISESVGGQVVSGSTSYEQAFVTDLAPPTAKLARVAIEVLGAVEAGEVFYVARMSFAPGRAQEWAMGGYSTTQTVRIERSLDGGETWSTAVDRVKTDLLQQARIYDRLMPYRTDVKYRAATVVDIGEASVMSAWSLTSTIRIESDLWAFRDPNDDLGEINAIVTGFRERDDESSSVHRPAGRVYPVVDTEGFRAGQGEFTLFVRGADLEKAKEVIQRTVPMVVQSPSGRVMNVRLVRREYEIEVMRHRNINVKYYEIGSM